MFIIFFLPHTMFLGFKDSPRKLLQLDRDMAPLCIAKILHMALSDCCQCFPHPLKHVCNGTPGGVKRCGSKGRCANLTHPNPSGKGLSSIKVTIANFKLSNG